MSGKKEDLIQRLLESQKNKDNEPMIDSTKVNSIEAPAKEKSPILQKTVTDLNQVAHKTEEERKRERAQRFNTIVTPTPTVVTEPSLGISVLILSFQLMLS